MRFTKPYGVTHYTTQRQTSTHSRLTYDAFTRRLKKQAPFNGHTPLLRSCCLYSLLLTKMMIWMYNNYNQAAEGLPALEEYDTAMKVYTNNDLGDAVYPLFRSRAGPKP